jgi:hypothetical protein
LGKLFNLIKKDLIMGFLDYLKGLFRAMLISVFWFGGGLFVIIVGVAFLDVGNMMMVADPNSIWATPFLIVGFIITFIGIAMIGYGYYRYTHSVHVRKEYHEY